MRLAVFVAAHDKVIDTELADVGAELAHEVSLLLRGHVLAHVLAVESPHVVELGADEESVLLTAADLRTDLGQALEGALVALLGHVVHPDGGWVGGGDIEVRLVHVQVHGGGHVAVEVLLDETVGGELGLG